MTFLTSSRCSFGRHVGFAIALVVLLLNADGVRAGGYYVGPVGAKAGGRAGAFTARADDLTAVYYNPAGLSFLDGLWLQIDNKSSYNFVEYERAPLRDSSGVQTATFAPVRSETPLQPLAPLVGIGFGNGAWAFALVTYARSGVARVRYPQDGPQRYLLTEREAYLLNNTLSVAWQPTPQVSLGLSLYMVVAPTIQYELAIAASVFGGLDPVSNELDLIATIDAADWFIPNAVLGVWYQPSPAFEVGLSGQVIPADVNAEGSLDLRFAHDVSMYGVEDREIVTYRNQVPAKNIRLTLSTPLSARLGARYIRRRSDGSELFDIECDISYETWSVVDTLTLNSDNLEATVVTRRAEIGVIEVEKRWMDTVGVSLGGDFNVVQDLLTLRAGTFWESPTAEPAYANVDFTTGQHVGATLGASLLLGDLSLALAYEYRVQPEVVTTDGQIHQKAPLDQEDARVVNNGRFRAHSHSAAVSASYGF